MSRNWVFLGLSFAGVFFAWSYSKTHLSPKEPFRVDTDRLTSQNFKSNRSLQPKNSPSQKPSPTKKVKKIDFIEVPLSNEQSDGPPPDSGGLIHFRVEQGLAIAYGDILLGNVESDKPIKQGYSEAPRTLQLWDKPEIPYIVDSKLPQPERIDRVVEYLNQHTPIRLTPYRGEADAIVFEPGSEHCLSVLGKMGGLQPIRLSQNCHQKEILHEVMHALGFIHEHSRPDRDEYVEVFWKNIQPPYQSEFIVVPDVLFEPLRGSSFDYQSVMLYEPNEFAKDPSLPTLKSVTHDKIDPIQEGLSVEDIRRIRTLFRL